MTNRARKPAPKPRAKAAPETRKGEAYEKKIEELFKKHKICGYDMRSLALAQYYALSSAYIAAVISANPTMPGHETMSRERKMSFVHGAINDGAMCYKLQIALLCVLVYDKPDDSLLALLNTDMDMIRALERVTTFCEVHVKTAKVVEHKVMTGEIDDDQARRNIGLGILEEEVVQLNDAIVTLKRLRLFFKDALRAQSLATYECAGCPNCKPDPMVMTEATPITMPDGTQGTVQAFSHEEVARRVDDRLRRQGIKGVPTSEQVQKAFKAELDELSMLSRDDLPRA